MSKHVRLKPFNPKRGHVLRKYTFGPTGQKFEEHLGWYIVDESLAGRLTTVKQTTDRDGADAFDVCTAAEAAAIDAKERKEKERKGAENATDLTTRDLRGGSDQFRRSADDAIDVAATSIHAPAGRAPAASKASPATKVGKLRAKAKAKRARAKAKASVAAAQETHPA